MPGSTLTATPGSWVRGPTSYSYLWDGFATRTNSVTLPQHWRGGTVQLYVTATNAFGTSRPVAALPVTASGALPANTALPVVKGSLVPGWTLTATPGSWVGPDELLLPLGRLATRTNSVTLPQHWRGGTVQLYVTATNAFGTSRPVAALPVTASGALPANTALPVVKGSLVPGSTLTATPGSWVGARRATPTSGTGSRPGRTR